ncbi:hypothetical protein HD806DRAFT_545643 [Xylariaceae sp. AK1471]|nr:hypothetical protein HD806DRAFT_545643 [Xylariaceae sp. AK1471]
MQDDPIFPSDYPRRIRNFGGMGQNRLFREDEVSALPGSDEQASYYHWTDLRLVLTAPTYLWDVLEHRTIRVQDMDECPNYICVSQTWGRWRRGPDTKLPGVPWLVPQYTLYGFRNLP